MTDNLNKLKRILREMFQFDQADLDFGIYRIMNQKRAEIEKFLEEDLLPQVKGAFSNYTAVDKAQITQKMESMKRTLEDAGVSAETSPKYQELQARLDSATDLEALEQDVFSQLVTFFNRYYDNGDFLSRRRYKAGVYALPYGGEEVKLHWANADQYYIKTTEYFRDYTFTLPSGNKVHFKIIAANTEQDNNKAQNGKERRFFLDEAEPFTVEDEELFIHFQYSIREEKQDDLNTQTVQYLQDNAASAGLNAFVELFSLSPTENNPNRRLVEKHLRDYTARNTFDYFIHKDLGGFLRRELDFYLKNEVIHIDDLDTENEFKVELYLSKIKVIKRIANKIIAFLEHLESFQKKLWLKKKFVVETNYCLTLDRVPKELYPRIITNEKQIGEWKHLFAIDEIDRSTVNPGYSDPLTVDFLKANPYLVLDTAFFDNDFKEELLASFEDLEESIDGLLVHSENFQALNLVQERYREQVKCIYIDPPYNTDASAILYKNDYKDSSWLSLMNDRVSMAHSYLTNDGIICVAIDDEEVSVLRLILESLFKKQIGIVPIRSNPAGRKTKGKFAPAHEYSIFFGKTETSIPFGLTKTEKSLSRFPKEDEKGRFAWANFIRSGSNDKREDRPKLFYPIFVGEKNSIRIPKMKWNEDKREYELLEQPKPSEVVVYPVIKKDNKIVEKNWQRGPLRVTNELNEYRVRRKETDDLYIDFKTRMDEESLPITWWDDKKYASANYGAAELKDLFGFKDFDFPKAIKLVKDCVRVANGNNNSLILDFFAGSGTTAHAVINLNREDGGRRKYIMVEMGDYFDTVLKPRIQKVIYSSDWRDGKPVSREGSSHMFKYLRLESYEDTLSNLEMKRTQQQQNTLDDHPQFREEYTLSYMLDMESRGSASLLNLEQFEDPFNYKLQIHKKGETRPVTIDLVETFNYLLGLCANQMESISGFKVVRGELPGGERTLIIWRNLREKSREDLNHFFAREDLNILGFEFDRIYVNGDHNLMNLKKSKDRWNVLLIEQEFKRLMFDLRDV